MRNLLIKCALFSLLACTAGCAKTRPFMNQGVIVGWNYGACSTCGGFYLNLSNETTINANTYYVLNYSDNLTAAIDQYSVQYNKLHAPIYVDVDWQPASKTSPSAPSNWIRVTDIRTRWF